MKSFEEMAQCWKSQKMAAPIGHPINQVYLDQSIRSGIKKERKLVLEYVIASGFWQWLLYAALTHMIVRFWGDWTFIAACLAGILLYIPFTILFIRKFTKMNRLVFEQSGLRDQDMLGTLKRQYQMLSGFFKFKRRFDWINIPLCCLLIVMIVYQYGLIPSVRENIIPAVIFFCSYSVLFMIATWIENKKRLRAPLQKIEAMIHELEEDASH